MDIYTVLGYSQSPKKLRSFGDSDEFYCYFPPPLPDIIVVFCSKWPESIPDKMSIMLHLDSESRSICKNLGGICRENMALCFVGEWEHNEHIISNEIQEKGRLVKLSVCQALSTDLDLDSQDSGIKDSNDHIEKLQYQSCYMNHNELEKENNCSIIKGNCESNSSLLDSRQITNGNQSLKRKSIFAFDDELDSVNNKHVKTSSENKCHSKGKYKQFSPLTPTSKKNRNSYVDKSLSSQKKTPRSSNVKKHITKSPVTPGFHELTVPTPRWGHSFCKIYEHKALIIGGQGLKSQISKDSIWQYDFTTGSFDRIEDESKGASRRLGHTANYDEKSALVYVFGGSKNKKWYSDIHTLDTKTMKWVALQTTGKAPVRAYHSCTLLHYELLIFGGVFPNPDPIPDGCSNDVHIFNTESNSWYQPIVNGEYPKARSGHSACFVDGLLYIFGGWDAPTCFNDLWILDTGLMSFKKLEVSGQVPSPRSWHGTALSSNQRSMIIYGGYDGNIALNDMHIFETKSKTWTHIGEGSHIAITGHKMLTLRTTGETGKKNEKIIVFGGGNNEGSFYNDVVDIHSLSL